MTGVTIRPRSSTSPAVGRRISDSRNDKECRRCGACWRADRRQRYQRDAPVCLGTETFNGRQFARIGIPVTVIGYAMMLLFAATYWRWLGWV